MDKSSALKILLECVKLYEINLNNQELLFLSLKNKKEIKFIQVKFLKSNFLHLTGVDVKNISPNQFYKKCLNNKLSINDFDFKEDGTTMLKLSVLKQLMNIGKIANMIGFYNGSKPRLCVEKLTGNTVACIGIKEAGLCYVPVTALKEDIRDLIIEKERVIAIFSKNIISPKYNCCTYKVKDFCIKRSDLPSQLSEKIGSFDFIDIEEKSITTESDDKIVIGKK